MHQIYIPPSRSRLKFIRGDSFYEQRLVERFQGRAVYDVDGTALIVRPTKVMIIGDNDGVTREFSRLSNKFG